MKKSNIVLLLASAMMLTACDSKDLTMPGEPQQARDKVPLQLISGISTTRGLTRAFDTSWDANDQIGVFTTVAGNSESITNSGSQENSNIAYKISTTEQTLDGTTHLYKAFEPSVESSLIYLPADGSDVDVYAYYPWTSGVSASSPLSITIPSTQTLANQKSVDILKAKALTSVSTIDIDHTTAQLLFSHILSKVLIKVKVGTGYSSADLTNRISVKITGQPTGANFQPIAQEFTITSPQTFVDIIPYEIPTPVGEETPDPDFDSNAIHTYRALLLPTGDNNSASNSNRRIVFTVGDKTPGATTTTYYFDLSNSNGMGSQEPNEFEVGKVTVFTLTLAATGITIQAAIQPWTTVNVSPDDPLYEVTGS